MHRYFYRSGKGWMKLDSLEAKLANDDRTNFVRHVDKKKRKILTYVLSSIAKI